MSFHPQMDYAPAQFHRSARTLADAGEPFAYTPENQAKFDEIVTHYPPDQRKSAILYALYLVQQQQGHITGAAMRSDLRQIRLEMADGTLAVIRLDTDEAGKGRFEVDVIRPPAPPSSQLEVRFESA